MRGNYLSVSTIIRGNIEILSLFIFARYKNTYRSVQVLGFDKDKGEVIKMDKEEIIKGIEVAYKMVTDLCDGKREWNMSIPAQENYDPDLVIGKALMEAKKYILESQENTQSGEAHEGEIDPTTHFICDSCGEPNPIENRERSINGDFCYKCVIERLRAHIESEEETPKNELELMQSVHKINMEALDIIDKKVKDAKKKVKL